MSQAGFRCGLWLLSEGEAAARGGDGTKRKWRVTRNDFDVGESCLVGLSVGAPRSDTCRTSGALALHIPIPALTRWAKVWRTSGASLGLRIFLGC